MPLPDQITIGTSTNPVPPPPPDTPRVFAMVAPAVPAGVTAKVSLYSNTSEMDAAGWTTAHVAYNAAAKMFSQKATVDPVGALRVIKREAIVAEVWTFDIITFVDATYELFIGGVLAATFVAVTKTATEIKDALLANFAIGAFAATHTGATVDTDTGSITDAVGGIPFVLTAAVTTGTVPSVAQTIPAVGVYGDLAAAFVDSQFWGIMAPAAVDAELDEAVRWAQADTTGRRNFVFAENADAGVFDSGDTDNLAVKWLTAAHTRVNLLSHPNATEYMAAAAVGRLGGAFPGARAWHKLPLAGSLETAVTATRTSAQTATMKARRISYTERQEGPESVIQLIGGRIPSGQFIFQRWAEDWWWYTIRAAIDAEMKADAGVNLTDDELERLSNVVSAAMTPLLDAEVIAPDYEVGFIPVANIPPGEVAIGDYQTTGRITATATITPKLRAITVNAVFDLVPT